MKRKAINLVLLNLTIFFALISIHEISHALIGSSVGCDYGRAVVFDTKTASGITGMLFSEPYTEMLCSNGTSQSIAYMGSFLVTVSFGLVFLSLNSPGKNMFLVISGLSLVFSSLDISLALSMESLLYPLTGSGFLLIILGEYLMASSYLKDDVPLDLFGMHEIDEKM